jgi:hypothetical protein
LERHALAGVLLEGLAISGDGLFEARGATLTLAERLERQAFGAPGRGLMASPD